MRTNGNLVGHNSKVPLWRQKPANSCQHWPAPPRHSCWTGGSLWILNTNVMRRESVEGTQTEMLIQLATEGMRGGVFQYFLLHQSLSILICRFLSYTLNSTMIRKQDATSVITAVASNREGTNLAWTFVQKHWEYMFTEWALNPLHSFVYDKDIENNVFELIFYSQKVWSWLWGILASHLKSFLWQKVSIFEYEK